MLVCSQGYLEMEGVCSGLWFMELALGLENHLQMRVLRKNLQMNFELK